jgi:TolB-like protein/DNA-binding winged helix-turn-helix (wHTH) protein/Tfp pilus assembly protein PilF
MQPPQVPRTVRFGAFELNLRTAELRKHGLRIKLQRQPAQILALLAARPAEIVSRDELRKALWPDDTFVDFDHGLNNAINRIREVLCDSVASPRYIETIPKQGYLFIANVEDVVELQSGNSATVPGYPTSPHKLSEHPHTATSPNNATAAAPHRRIVSRTGQLLGIFALIMSMGARTSPPSMFPGRAPSIAVLPLTNLTGDAAQDYLADGMTDALITDLAQIRSLRVISRTSAMRYKASSKALPEIARELGVEAVVEGSVARSGQRVRVNAQLIEAQSDQHLWAKVYEGNLQDVLALQGSVALAVASEIQIRLTPEEHDRLTNARPVKPEAYETYLKGRFFTREFSNSTEDGIPYLKRAIELDPGYAAAHAALAEVYSWNSDTLEDARREAQIAIDLDPNQAEAHHVLAWVKHTLDWDSAGAEKEYRRALELSPGDAEAHESYGYFLSHHGKIAEALAEMEIARQSNPVSTKLNLLTGLVLYSDHRYDQALASFQRVLELSPDSLGAERYMLRAYEQKGDFEKAIEIFPKAAAWFDVDETHARALANELRHNYESLGAKGYWQTRLLQQTREKYDGNWRVALTYAHLGENDKTIALLQQECTAHSHALRWWLKADPVFDPLRADQRFQDIVRKAGLPPDSPTPL